MKQLVFKPETNPYSLAALGLAICTEVVFLYLTTNRLLNMVFGLTMFWWILLAFACLLVLLLSLYLLVANFFVSYRLDREALVVRWGLLTYLIPLHETKIIKRIPKAGIRSWLGFFPARYGNILFLSTRYKNDALVHLQHQDRSFLVSPADSGDFLAALYRVFKIRQVSQELYSDEGKTYRSYSYYPGKEFIQPLFHDQIFVAFMVISLLALFASGMFVFSMYPDLPRQMMLQYSLDSSYYTFSDPKGLLWYPALAFILFVVFSIGASVFIRRERLASYILLAGGILAQGLTFVPMFTAVFLRI